MINDSVSFDMWVQSILKIASNYKIYEKMSESAYNQWNEKFSFESNYQVWKDLIKPSKLL